MGKFFNGVLLGIGLSWLIAPMRGQEMRSLVGERIQKIRGSLPDNTQLAQQATQIASTVQDYTAQASSQVKDTVSKLSNVAQQTSTSVKQAGQNVVDTTQQAATQATQRVQSQPSTSTISSDNTTGKGSSQNDQLSTIPGMEPEPQSRLESEGITTIQQLLAQTATKEERAELAQKIGMTTNMLRMLVDRADLMRLQGVGADVATMLEEAGVNGCKDLQRRNPEHLYATLTKAQESGKTVSRPPELEQITRWIAEAMIMVDATQK